jgi:hypothetical protein
MSSLVGIDMNKASYLTWYEFKKDLQKEANCSILNREWLQIKPRAPLPWDGSFVDSTLVKLSKGTK